MIKYKHEVVQSDMASILKQSKAHECFYGKTILITGATGMLATYCIYYFLYLNDYCKANISIFALARNEEKSKTRFLDILNRTDLHFLYQDIADPLMVNVPVHYIFHMAGSASAYAIVNDPIGIISANVGGTIQVMKLALQNAGCRVVFASTREVYGALPCDITEIDESLTGTLDSLNARSCYPESKRLAENICVNMGRNNALEYVIARIAHVYGPGMTLHNDGRVMSDLLCNAVEGKDITLKSDGSAMRAFCYLSDAIRALLLLALEGVSGQAYNVANELEEISIKQLAILISASCPQKNIHVTYREPTEQEQAGYLSIKRVRLSTRLLEQLGWKPSVCLGEGISKTLAVL